MIRLSVQDNIDWTSTSQFKEEYSPKGLITQHPVIILKSPNQTLVLIGNESSNSRS